MAEFETVPSLINLWPSLAVFAADAGVSYEAAKQMRRRGSIPVGYWPAIIAAADTRGIDGVSSETLMASHAASVATEA